MPAQLYRTLLSPLRNNPQIFRCDVFDWFRGTKRQSRDELGSWRTAWAAAIEGTNAPTSAELRQRLTAAAASGADIEVELEMLDALEQLLDLKDRAASGTLPTVETHHRVIGSDRCHFSAPASLTADQGEGSAGRVLLTGAKAIFVGGGRTAAAQWHFVHAVLRLDRDVLLVRADRTPAAHYRFNTYADAVIAAYLAEQLRPRRTSRL